jgi:hypothetical protein
MAYIRALQIILPAHGYFEAENNTRSLIDGAPHCTALHHIITLLFLFDFREILFRLDSLEDREISLLVSLFSQSFYSRVKTLLARIA